MARTGSLSGPKEPGRIKAGHSLPGRHHIARLRVWAQHMGSLQVFEEKQQSQNHWGWLLRKKKVKWAKYSHPTTSLS